MFDFIGLADLLRVGGTVFGITGIALALGLIFFPQQLLQLNNALNKQISTDKLRIVLEKDYDITSIIMQARILSGVVTLLLSFILLIIALRI